MVLTNDQVKLYRMASGEFDGLAIGIIAEKLHVSAPTIRKRLRGIEKIAPQLFPLLTKQEAEVLSLYESAGWPVVDIAEKMGVSESRIYDVLKTLEKKGRLMPIAPVGKILYYDSGSMDIHVRRKF